MNRKARPSPFPTAHPVRLPASLVSPRPAPAMPASVPSRLGGQLRALRVAANLSGAKLAAAAGISRSMLSHIERGQASPSVRTLEKLAAVLQVPVSRLFADQAARSDFSHVPSGKGLVVERVGAVQGYRYELLGHLLSGNLFVEPYLVNMTEDAEPYVSFQHPGIKFLRMVSGSVQYRYGPRSIELKTGDSLMFDATALHGIEAVVKGPVAYLSIVVTIRD